MQCEFYSFQSMIKPDSTQDYLKSILISSKSIMTIYVSILKGEANMERGQVKTFP